MSNDLTLEDDGGSAKNNDRKIRRDKIKLVKKFLLVIANIFIQIQLYNILQQRKSENTPNPEFYSGGTDTYRWSNPRMLPPIIGENIIDNQMNQILLDALDKIRKDGRSSSKAKKRERNPHPDMTWEAEADDDIESEPTKPFIDYTSIQYFYPPVITEPPLNGEYPPLKPLRDMLHTWPQDNIDDPPELLHETLQYFDYSDSEQMKAAKKFRDMELPFKIYNVPELQTAAEKWTDKYISQQFDGGSSFDTVKGWCEESKNHFFSYYKSKNWVNELMGEPPTFTIDWNFSQWAKHARYADKVRLPTNKPHYYWQTTVPATERFNEKSTWKFISNDLPSFSNPLPTFFGFEPKYQKGIQCRFGERGIVAATHYDDGRNMVAMITGAKRYILAPPNQCHKIGIVTDDRHPVYRHSLLNFGHINLLKSESQAEKAMPSRERKWQEKAGNSLAIETVLKQGEVLYIPSYWFHYIIGLQKNAQCNTRSGRSPKTDVIHFFGGYESVKLCLG